MKITIIGSMKFYEKLKEIKTILEKQGHNVVIPLPDEHYKESGKIKRDSMEDYNKEIEKSDAILVANYEKNNIKNYIGVNSIMEVGMAFNRKKKIFILNQIPENCIVEFNAIDVIELNGDLTKIK
jgi:diphthamide synthase subunit DPH2